METEKEQTKQKIKLEKVFGIILLLPPIISVLLFFINLFFKDLGSIPELSNLSYNWSGGYSVVGESGGAGFTSSAPIYFGLMAIAGAILLKGTDKK